MKTFDLKKFRGTTGLTQTEFAKKIKRSQTTVSKIEQGTQEVNDKFLDAIAKAFAISLEEYKSYNQADDTLIDKPHNNHLSAPRHEISDLEIKYKQLLEDKAKMDEKYFDLLERCSTLEDSLIQEKENTKLLKKIANNIEVLMKASL